MMMKHLGKDYLLPLMAGLFGLWAVPVAQAATPVKPLGLPIGVATLKQVKAKYPSRDLKQTGANAYSNGPMFKLNGKGLQIEGLQAVLFIFDKNKILTAVQLTLHRDRFDVIMGHLQRKYALVNKTVPFVGNKAARFAHGDSVIELNAPHLSFQMTATYMTKTFEKAFRAGAKRKQEQRRQREGAQF
jgi:hypothetical protein